MEGVAKDYRKAHQNHSDATAFALNLAEDAFHQAAMDASPHKKKAMDDFNNALSTLKSTSPTGNWSGAEKVVMQKSNQVHKVERHETEDAKARLRNKRREQSKQVRQAYDEARGAARTLLKDRDHLENAMRHAGRSENEYETVSGELEHHAESRSEYAARNMEEASHAMEHIFERAEDRLMDREEHMHEEASQKRSQAIEGAVDALRQQAGKQKLYSSMPATIDLMAKADQKQRDWKQEESNAQQAVDSDKEQLESASKNLEKVAAGFRSSVKNQTHAQNLARSMAKEVYDQAAHESYSKKHEAMNDFKKYMSELQSTSATSSWTHAERNAREQSKYVDKLQEEEENNARKKLKDKHKRQKDEVRKSYDEVHQAARNLLRDRNRLEKAMSHNGRKESEYEKEEMKNEFIAEHSQERAEQHSSDADDAAENIFELASEHLRGLQRDSRREQQATAHERRRAIYDAVETLRYAREGRTYNTKQAHEETRSYEKRGDAIGEPDANEKQLQKIQHQMKNLQKGMPKPAKENAEFFALSAGPSILCLLSGASFALLIIFFARRSRPVLIARPLLG